MFDILKTKKELQEQIGAQAAQIDALGVELTTATEAKTESERMLAECKTELLESQELLASAKMQLEAQSSTVAELQATLETTRQAYEQAQRDVEAASEATAERISNEAARLLASAGHPPIKLTKAEISNGKKQLSKADFDRLTPTEKSNFARNGGRLID